MSRFYDCGNQEARLHQSALQGLAREVTEAVLNGGTPVGTQDRSRPARLLLIDRDAECAQLIMVRTQCHGYRVDLAHEEERGRALLGSEAYDVLCIGQSMLEYAGPEVVRSLARDSRCPPVVVLIEPGDDSMAVEALKHGAFDCVVAGKGDKSLTLLLHAIERALQMKRLIAQQTESRGERERLISEVQEYRDRLRRRETRTQQLAHENEELRREIRERVRAEDVLKESEKQYRAIFSNAAFGIDLVDEQGRFSHVNAALARMLGYTPEEIKGLSFRAVTYPADVEASRASLEALVRGDTQSYRVEKRYVRKNGEVMCADLCVSAIRGEEGEFVAAIGVVVDITEKKEAEEALRSSEERFRAIFESARDSIFIKDLSLRFTQVNPAAERLLGHKASEILGRCSEDFVGKEAGKHITDVELRVLRGETIEDERTIPINGVPMTFHQIRTPLRGANREIVGVCGISRDVTGRRFIASRSRGTAGNYPSKAMRLATAKARQVAQTESIILLLGESGSGKDFLARYIHDHSRRSNGPYFAINCAAVAHDLAESELFGHESGAFTGARGRKRGLLELAEGGTLLLNEIGELSLPMQSKLLTFLDTRSFLRVGGEKSVRVDARLVAATHRDLEEEVAQGRFLEPLFYRLNVSWIRIPSLRQRIEDIPMLVRELLAKLAGEMQLSEMPTIDPETLAKLVHYHWPGNIRELRNVLERGLILSSGECLTVSDLQHEPEREATSHTLSLSSERTLRDVTDEVTGIMCADALRRCEGNKTKAANILGISRDSMYRHMKRLGIVQ